MATLTRSRTNEINLLTSQMFAQVFQAYMECSTEIQEAIRDMVQIVNDPDATEDERLMACSTIAEALFPKGHDGHPGIDLETLERRDRIAQNEAGLEQTRMDAEEKTFADRVDAMLKERGMTQNQLAEACGMGQPAVSMLLSRTCRPQRRTVEKIAGALGVPPHTLWPTGD